MRFIKPDKDARVLYLAGSKSPATPLPPLYMVVPGSETHRLTRVMGIHTVEQLIGVHDPHSEPSGVSYSDVIAQLEHAGREHAYGAAATLLHRGVELHIKVVRASETLFTRLSVNACHAQLSLRLGCDIRFLVPRDYIAWQQAHEHTLKRFEVDCNDAHMSLPDLYNLLQSVPADVIVEGGIGSLETDLSTLPARTEFAVPVVFKPANAVTVEHMRKLVRHCMDRLDRTSTVCYLGSEPLTANTVRALPTSNGVEIIDRENGSVKSSHKN